MTLENRIESIDTVFTQKIDDEIVLFDSRKGLYYGLDSIGAMMWEDIKGYSDLYVVHQNLLDKLDVDAQTLESDLLIFVEKLIENNLLKEKY